MRKIGLVLLLSIASSAAAAPYWIKVNAQATGRYTVQVSATTNLPDGAVLSASLGLADQKPNDVFIGTDFQKITVKGGKASILIDGTKRVFPLNSTLPAGLYDVEVDFQPLWPENRALAGRLKVTETLAGLGQVRLGASGANAAVVQKKAEQQKWVMLNVNSGDKWNPAFFTKKFGQYKELPLSNGNPRILKMYYFPALDMTFMVNVYKGEIVVWRSGKANR